MMQPTQIEGPRLKSSRGRAVRGALVLFAAALVAVGLVVVGTSVPASASSTFTTNATSDVTGATAPSATPGNGEQGRTSNSSHLLEKAQREGSVRAIVGLRTDFTPEGRLSGARADDQRDAIERVGAGLREELAGTGYSTLREYETVPYVALKLTPKALRAVQGSPLTTSIQEDVAVPADLAESSTIVQAPAMWENNVTGAGKTIAVLDAGVDRFHPFLGGRVVEEACFSSGSDCPNGQKTQTGMDSAAPCTYAPMGCEHGTHVAGIAAGQGSDFSGVAPNANIMAVQVFSRHTGSACDKAGESPCTLTSTSDQIKGLERVYQLRNTHTFASVNMSFGVGRFTSRCDSDSRKAIIDNLKAAGIATVIASGNDGFTDAVSAPACISSAVTVGNTTKRDDLASDSNMDRGVDLLAPGRYINSSVPGGGFASLSGTSMAAPHVAGAFALLLEKRDPFESVSSNVSDLQARGKLVLDTRAGGTAGASRINIADAARVHLANDNFGSPKALSGATTSIDGINVAARRESGEPDHVPLSGSLGEDSVWYSWTAPLSGPVKIDTCTSSFDTALAAYTGSDIGSLSRVADNDDACDVPNHRGSKIAFDAVAGRDYRIAVAGVEGGLAASEGTFTLNAAYAPSSNDDFSDSQGLSGNSATVKGTTLAATREFGEPDHYTTTPDGFWWIGEHSVWYSWTAPFSGPVEMNTCTANIDSILAVYTGSDISTLGRVADDRLGCPEVYGSKVTFDAVAGTTYRIAVADTGGDYTEDTFTLKVIDRTPPGVTGTTPADDATGVLQGANVRATFSEAMRVGTINADTFRLRKAGSDTNVAAVVSYDLAARTATLNPDANLQAGATYVATVTTGTTDLSGNQLDQDPNTTGNQSKSWKFQVTR